MIYPKKSFQTNLKDDPHMYLCGMRYLNVSLENNIKRFGDACIKPEGGWGTLDGVWGFSNPPPSDFLVEKGYE